MSAGLRKKGKRGRSECSDDTPLVFHSTHGSSVQLSADRRRSTRKAKKYCKAICFSHRPVSIGEGVSFVITAVTNKWDGHLRFGFTKHDPANIKSSALPRFMCPDLTDKPGYWAHEIPMRFARNGTVLSFYLTFRGEVMMNVNGEDNGCLFDYVDTNGPVWAMVDVYGNTVSIDLVEVRQADHVRWRRCFGSISLPGGSTSPTHDGNLGQRQAAIPPAVAAPAMLVSAPAIARPPQEHHPPPPTTHYIPLPFHTTTGRNIALSRDETVAERKPNEVTNGFVFTARPLRCGEMLTIEIVSASSLDEELDIGGLTFGMTTCDPATLASEELPDDSDFLLDRLEYWIVNKDVCLKPRVGDKLSFHLTLEGEVHYDKNGHKMATLMHVDHTLEMWMFFDVYGSTHAIRTCGIVDSVTSPPPPSSLKRELSRLEISSGPAIAQHNPDECKVCMERRVDCVLTPCGHVVLCYECAFKIKNSEHASCPICRNKIEIVTKMYRA